jgi:hypothetical protein
MPGSVTRLLSALFIATSLCGQLSGRALAAPDESGQKPPQDQVQDQGQTPPEQRKCVVNNSDFTPNNTYVMELTNTCEMRIRCTVKAFITNAGGQTRDEAVLTLEPASAGAGARKVHIVKLKDSYGMAQSSQSCEGL